MFTDTDQLLPSLRLIHLKLTLVVKITAKIL